MSSYGMYLSAAGMKLNDHRQTLVANNMANANTTGFKRDLDIVMARRMERDAMPGGFRFAHPVLDGLAGGLNVRPTHTSFAQGPIEDTERPLDVAIRGEGFFTVSDGKVTRYTRDGEFTRNATGELVLSAGNGRWRVLSDDGAPIVLDAAGGRVSIRADGTVRQGDEVVAKLNIVTTENKQALRKVGENLFDAGDAEMVAADPELVPEAREASNYDVMRGLASMVEVSRAYQLNATMIQLQDQITGQAVSRIARAR